LHKRYTIDRAYKHLEQKLIHIDQEFVRSDKSIHNARNQLKIVEIDGLKLVVKSFKVPNLLNKIVYTFLRDSKAKKSYDNAIRLEELHISTPQPVAYLEFYRAGLLNESYFITLLEEYDFTIREVFHHKVKNTDEILKQFTKFTYDIHCKGVWHVDYSLGNILITQKDKTYRFALVDINRMEFKIIPTEEGLKNFNKFWEKFEGDLKIIAKEYAKLSNFDEHRAIEIVESEAQKVIDYKNRKRKLKQMVGTK